jgi:homoserine kinase
MEPIRFKVPATSANLGPGFDTLGMALGFYNHFYVSPSTVLQFELGPATCVDVSDIHPESNLVIEAYRYYFEQRGEVLRPATLVADIHIPLSRGLGSSSTAIVGGLLMANALHPEPLSREQLAQYAIALEGHPDNVVPALMGGICLAQTDTQWFRLVWPDAWQIILVIPAYPVSTQKARLVLPEQYSRQDMVSAIRKIANWVLAIETQDFTRFQAAVSEDVIHQPYRAQLIPEFEKLRSYLALQPYPTACTISGSGSTLAVFSPSLNQTVKAALREYFPECRVFSVKPDHTGSLSF